MSKEDLSKLIEVGALSLGISFVVGVFRGIVYEKYGSFATYTRCILASVMVGVLVGWGLEDSGFSITTRSSIIVLTALVADDVLISIVAVAKVMGQDPLDFFHRLAAAYRGLPPKAPKE